MDLEPLKGLFLCDLSDKVRSRFRKYTKVTKREWAFYIELTSDGNWSEFQDRLFCKKITNDHMLRDIQLKCMEG